VKFVYYNENAGFNQEKNQKLSVTHDMSGFVAHNLSGLRWSPVEVTDETDGDTTGEPEDAI
jgi:hypothetical protein